MYIFGGDNYKTLESCEKWEEGEWKALPNNLTEARDWVSCTLLKDLIYIAGNKVTAIDEFDSSTEIIRKLDLTIKSDNSTLAAWGNCIYSFQTNDVKKYSVNTDDQLVEQVNAGTALKWWSYTGVYWKNCYYIVMGGNEFLWRFNFETNELEHIHTLKDN